MGKEDFVTHQWIEGPAIAFVKAASPVAISAKGIEHRALIRKLKLQKTKSKGHGVKAERLAKYASMRGYHAAICYIDCDSNIDKDHKAKISILTQGFTNSGVSIRCIPMVPMAMIENWLLADAQAYAVVFKQTPKSPALPSKPETIWGSKHDNLSNHPKRYFNRVIDQFQTKPDDYLNDLAYNSRPTALESKCPSSYSPFYKDIQSLKDI
ncbi:MAG: DUF4276 family protein [Candidatus Cloacimonetes bacterium]|nr:DUF4276 family protein [Candidatus Cloacimonadota bacterium]